jgi:hypothetical protein
LDVEVVKNGTSNVWTMPKPYSYYRDFDIDDDDYASWADYVVASGSLQPTGSAVVNAQVLLDILNHPDHGEDNSPFSDGSSCWFVHSYNDVDWWKGVASTWIYVPGYPDEFIDGPSLVGQTTYLGDLGDNPGEIDWHSWNKMRFIMAHEYGHNLGLEHLELGSADGSINYGAYGLMRGSVLTPYNNDTLYQNDGFMSLHPRSLATLGWIDVETVESAKEFVLTNVRSEGGYAIEIPATSIGGSSSLESFILSYHENQGWDADYPTWGVAIWHNRYSNNLLKQGWMDLEAASKRWYCNHNTDIEDADTGVDMGDRLWWTANPGCPVQHVDYYDYFFSFYSPGEPGDFFNPDSCATSSWGNQEVIEFSFRTNPNTNLSISDSDRLAGDTIETSLAVLMAFPDLGGSPTVTVMPAPYELILTPATSAEVAFGGTVEVTWADYFADTDDADTIMDQVIVSFSRDGPSGPFLPVGTAAYDAHSFDWVVDDQRFVSIEDLRGQLKVEFTNTVTDLVGPSTVDSMRVAGTALAWEW